MNQTESDAAIVNAGDPATVAMTRGMRGRTFSFGFGEFGPGVARGARAQGGEVVVDLGAGAPERYAVRSRALRGDHNVENAMAAVLAARLAGVPASAIQAGLDSFPGLAHRIESAGVVGGVEYVNDSKATNVESTLVALKAFPANLWLIAGGRGKGAPYAPMVEASRGRLKGVLTIGEDAGLLEAAYRGVVPVIACGDLAGAVAAAHRRAAPGDVVLLSPACASYDQFKNFEERGERFKQLVKGLQG
jgi:UDP-N-acetylmuramoylalanine--D-glutamate ligase